MAEIGTKRPAKAELSEESKACVDCKAALLCLAGGYTLYPYWCRKCERSFMLASELDSWFEIDAEHCAQYIWRRDNAYTFGSAFEFTCAQCTHAAGKVKA